MDVELPRDFREFLALPNAHRVEYLLIGGYAVGYHGYPRATNDIDVWARVSAGNADRIVRALLDFGFAVPEITPALSLEEGSIVRMGQPPLRIGVATSISGGTSERRFRARQAAVLDGIDVPVISRGHLLVNKRAAGRRTWRTWVPLAGASASVALCQVLRQRGSQGRTRTR